MNLAIGSLPGEAFRGRVSCLEQVLGIFTLALVVVLCGWQSRFLEMCLSFSCPAANTVRPTWSQRFHVVIHGVTAQMLDISGPSDPSGGILVTLERLIMGFLRRDF
jgi:hypothetical protein